jgi:preprotein translocase subunit YajC
MIGALILLFLIISVIVLMIKVRGQRKRINKLEQAVNK